MPERDASDMIARSPGVVLPPTGSSGGGEPSPEDFAKILEFGDDRIERKPEDYYAFRMIVSSDGVDSFFTRPDSKTSLVNYAEDLKHGQSLLSSHKTDTLSYGVSYDGELVDADPVRREYEASFFRRYAADVDKSTKKWTIGKYAIPRNMTVNGQNTEDLIRGIQMGAIRRVSISFTVGRYLCDIDGNDMIAGFFGVEGSGDCKHMPGVSYEGKGVATALMVDNDLHETSLVFKNSSPSAMFLRKAEEMARRGMISESDIVKLEERTATRLPRREGSGLWAPGTWVSQPGTTSTSSSGTNPVIQISTREVPAVKPNETTAETVTDADASVTADADATSVTDADAEAGIDRHAGHMHVGLNVDADDIKGGHGTDYDDVPGDEIDDPEAAAEMLAPGILEQMDATSDDTAPGDESTGDETPAEKLANAKKAASPDVDEERHKGHYHDGDSVGGHFTKKPDPFPEGEDEKADIDVYAPRPSAEEQAAVAAQEARMTKARDMARDVLGRLAAFETRDTELAAELGEPVSVEAVRRLGRDAKLGRDLFLAEVDKAVKARIAVDGDGFNAEKWRSLLASSRDIELVQGEIDSWNTRKGEKFTAGRQVKPGPLPEKRAATAPRATEPIGKNIIESLTGNGAGDGTSKR